MRTRLLQESEGRRSYAVVFSIGEEAIAGLRAFADEQGLRGSQLTAIGAFQGVVLGYFDWSAREYARHEFNEQVEVASLIGNIAVDDDGTRVLHAHAVVGRRDGTALAGHLLAGQVRPTLEVIVEEMPEHLHRRRDAQSGLLLLAP